jgi:glutamate 5-kinase
MYETKLRGEGVPSAQVLLTHADLADRERYLNARSTLLTLLRWAWCRHQRERHGGQRRDQVWRQRHLGALVANLVEADALVILTDQRSLYSADPRKNPDARFIDVAEPATLSWKPWPAARACPSAAAA